MLNPESGALVLNWSEIRCGGVTDHCNIERYENLQEREEVLAQLTAHYNWLVSQDWLYTACLSQSILSTDY
jgi:hypothetical protein